MLREYIWLAWYGMVDGRFVVPSMRTPSTSVITPGSVSSVLPPVSAARSTITEPGFIDRTMSAVMSFGAGRPGIAAVVMTMSFSFTAFARSSTSLRCASAESSLA